MNISIAFDCISARLKTELAEINQKVEKANAEGVYDVESEIRAMKVRNLIDKLNDVEETMVELKLCKAY